MHVQNGDDDSVFLLLNTFFASHAKDSPHARQTKFERRIKENFEYPDFRKLARYAKQKGHPLTALYLRGLVSGTLIGESIHWKWMTADFSKFQLVPVESAPNGSLLVHNGDADGLELWLHSLCQTRENEPDLKKEEMATLMRLAARNGDVWTLRLLHLMGGGLEDAIRDEAERNGHRLLSLYIRGIIEGRINPFLSPTFLVLQLLP